MIIQGIEIERQGNGTTCGTLSYRVDGRRASLLWLLQWRRGQKLVVEFVPAEGASQPEVRAHHAELVDAVAKEVFERTSRKSLFTT